MVLEEYQSWKSIAWVEMSFWLHLTLYQRWYDGEVTPLKVHRKEGNGTKIFMRIVKIEEFKNYHWRCYQDSFYRTWANQITVENLNNLQLTHPSKNKTVVSKCSFERVCIPESSGILPGIRKCKNLTKNERNCNTQGFWRLTKLWKHALSIDDREKACHIKEYVVESLKITEKKFKNNKQGLTVSFNFKAPTFSRVGWTSQLYKTVYEEYRLVNEITLTGVVGGTIGMFVGLSFMDLASGIMNSVYKTCIYFSKK